MKERPYIGVTGATTKEEVSHLVKTFKNNGFTMDSFHIPMVGILVSHATLRGESVQNRRYPAFANVLGLLQLSAGSALNTIHYNARELEYLYYHLAVIFNKGIYGENICRAVQLNIPWPEVKQLRRIKDEKPDLKIIMQLSSRSLKDRTPEEVVKLFEKYCGIAEYALIDTSGGRGEPFDQNVVVPYYLTLQAAYPNLSLGVAGGLSGENVIEKCREFSILVGTENFSIDAEGKLRDQLSPKYGDDTYNPRKVESYLKQAAALFN